MKINYKGCEISVYREGNEFLVFSIIKDGFEVTSGFSEGRESVREFMNGLKSTVDDFIENPSDYK